jgi:hypothetical protein
VNLSEPVAPNCLLVGWFSTIGDLDVLHQTIRWIESGGGSHVVAPYASSPIRLNKSYVLPQDAADASITHLIAICGPMWRTLWQREGFSTPAYAKCRKVGLNLSMIEDTSLWNPFDVLIERDSVASGRADMAFLAPQRSAPVVGICLVHPQAEYGDRQRHDQVTEILQRVFNRSKTVLASISTDTLAPDLSAAPNPLLETQIAHCDVLVTTRLHGMVYALRNCVPPVVIDPIAGGAKVAAQARAIGWPHYLTADRLSEDNFAALLETCLAPGARAEAAACLNRARELAGRIGRDFSDAIFALPGEFRQHDIQP